MDITIQPGKLCGSVAAIPSKSQAHRLLICAAFADKPTHLKCSQINRDIAATMDCLRALGASICPTDDGYLVHPIESIPEKALLNCHESGSTLRFFLPIAGALGVDATFQMAGRLPQRPLSPLWEELIRMGCSLTRPTADTVRITGKLRSGAYSVAGNVSSQFITGLLYALSLLPGVNTLTVTGKVESLPYIRMTLDALKQFKIGVKEENQCYCVASHPYQSPGDLTIDGDWSNAAFWLAAKTLGSELAVTNLNYASTQGDREIVSCLQALEKPCRMDASQIPDLVPVLAVVAGEMHGCEFYNAARLRLKETDRLVTTAAIINNLGGQARILEDSLVVEGTGYRHGTVDATNDHRIAMAAAVAATVCTGPVTIRNAQSVEKSYPNFWDEYRRLGGKI